MPLAAKSCRNLNAGAPMGMPSCLASSLRATMQPSLLLSTTTGLYSRSGRKTRSELLARLAVYSKQKRTGTTPHEQLVQIQTQQLFVGRRVRKTGVHRHAVVE